MLGAAAGGGEGAWRQSLHDQACLHTEAGNIHLSSVLADRGGHGIRDLRRRHLTHDRVRLEAGGPAHIPASLTYTGQMTDTPTPVPHSSSRNESPKPQHGELRGVVDREPRRRQLARDRGHEDDVPCEPFRLALLRQVGHDHPRTAELTRELLQGGLVARREDEIGSLAVQAAGDVGSETGRRAGQEDGLTA